MNGIYAAYFTGVAGREIHGKMERHIDKESASMNCA